MYALCYERIRYEFERKCTQKNGLYLHFAEVSKNLNSIRMYHSIYN